MSTVLTDPGAAAPTGTTPSPAPVGSPLPERPAPVFLLLAELGALALAVGTAAALNRLFVGWSFLTSLLVPIVAAWGTAVVMRRLRWPVRVALPVSLGFALVVLTWRYAPGTGLAGVVPTPSTVTAVSAAVRDSFGDFSRLIAPVEPTGGFLVVLAALFWVFGFFADTGCFRYRSPVQAALPYAATFVAVGVLARSTGRTGAVVAFGAGLAFYAVTQRALSASEGRWIRGEQDRGAWSVAAVGGVLAVLAVLAALVVGPRLPGDTEAVVDLRALGREGGSRTVVSPFVGVRSLLGERSDSVMFTVESPVASYWRLTSLEQYDQARAIWVSRGSYERVDDVVGSDRPEDVPATRVDQRYEIASLGGLWLPAAFQPVVVDADQAISYDPGSDSIITRTGQLTQGTGYRVRSEVVSLDAAALAGTTAGAEDVDGVYTEDPELSPEVERTAREVTAGATTPYEQALALQTFFRSDRFDYDDEVDYRDEADPTLAFLLEGRGFCQQFASTFALMARSLGLPARVAVGFTPGDQVDLDDFGATAAGGDGTAARDGTDAGGQDPRPGFVVRGRHAHAWPEVHLDGVGWVAFEPTPSRGNPQATGYTGVPEEQAEPPLPQQATTTTTVAPATPSDSTPSTLPSPSPAVDAVGDPDALDDAAERSDTSPWPFVALAVLAVLVALAVRVVLRARRRRHLLDDPHGGRVAVAWDDAVEWLTLAGVRPARSETPDEFVARARRRVDVAGLEDLARAETVRRFGPGDPPEELADEAERAAVAVREQVRTMVGRRERIRRLVR